MDAQPLSSRNPEISHLRRLLGRRRARLEAGQYVVEGATLLDEALDVLLAPDAVYVDSELPLDPGEAATLARARESGVRVRRVAPGVLARRADTVTFSGVMSVLPRVARSLDSLLASEAQNDSSLVLVLAGLSDPGNAGTLMRSAEASGAAAVVFTAGSVDPFGPKTVRASAGSVFRLEIVEGVELNEVLEVLGTSSYMRVGTSAHDGTPFDELDMRGRVALVLGNEAHGLTPESLDHLDHLATIPMVGRAESINVAMAGTLICFEALRQRRTDWTDNAMHDRVGR